MRLKMKGVSLKAQFDVDINNFKTYSIIIRYTDHLIWKI